MAEVIGNCENCYYDVDEGGQPLCPEPGTKGVNACAIAKARFANFLNDIAANPDDELLHDVLEHKVANCPHQNCEH
jgi:hypothetical protein